jgi:hypothetical protein
LRKLLPRFFTCSIGKPGFPSSAVTAVPDRCSASQHFTVQIVLQYYHGGHHIDNFAPFFALHIRINQDAFRRYR